MDLKKSRYILDFRPKLPITEQNVILCSMIASSNNRRIMYLYKDIAIELVDEHTFISGLTDQQEYKKQYFAESLESSSRSYFGVIIYDGDIQTNSCLLIGSAGTTVHKTSSLINGDSLVVCCGDSLFSLHLPTLLLDWQSCLDLAACFGVVMLGNDYLVHGELEISKVNKDGELIWAFSGADIFVRYNGEAALTINKDHIKVVDWQNNEYVLDFDGKLLWDSFR